MNPLIPASPSAPRPISYFCLENVPYHGNLVTVLYDRDGKKYRRGAGLSVYVNGKRVVKPSPLGKKRASLPRRIPSAPSPALANLAVRVKKRGYPIPSASVESSAAGLQQAVDGRVWFFPNVRNYWTNAGSAKASPTGSAWSLNAPRR